MLVTQTSGTQVKPLGLAVYNDGGWVNVGYPAALSVAFRVTHIVTKLWRFST